jgi:hypothetical protein
VNERTQNGNDCTRNENGAERSEVVSAPQRCQDCGHMHLGICQRYVEAGGFPEKCGCESVDGGARPDRFDEFAKEVTARVKMFSPTIGFHEKDMAHVARQWFGGATDGGARELEQLLAACRNVLDGDEALHFALAKLRDAVEAVDRRKR